MPGRQEDLLARLERLHGSDHGFALDLAAALGRLLRNQRALIRPNGSAQFRSGTQGSLPDVLVPDVGVNANVARQKLDTLARSEVDDVHSVLLQPAQAALEIDRFAYDDGSDLKLPHEAAAVPAGRQGRRHHRIAIRTLPSGLSEGIRLAVDRRVPLLHAAVVPAAEQAPLRVEERGADGDASLRQAQPGFVDRDAQHRLEVHAGHSKISRVPLSEYRRKRRFGVTPEPRGKAPRSRKKNLAYVVQKHRATALHYDFRLEWAGVMHSWAIPKGPSLDPSVKRLAMPTEPHPIEYNAFEGIIPEGEYGGGTVLIWDRGTWVPEVPDVAAALTRGELKFSLQGEKLTGSWVLVRTRRGEGRPSWLLIKHRDEAASTSDIAQEEPRSVVSARLLFEIARDEGGDVRKAAEGDPPGSLSGRSTRPK